MLFKRYLVLAACVLLFIIGYIGYFAYTNHQIEDRFRAERAKFGVEGTTLTAATTIPSDSIPAQSHTTAPAVPDSASSGSTNSTPAATAAPDANPMIGPVPPTSSTPDNSASPSAPVSPDTNAAPAAPSSTMRFPGANGSPFLLASYHPYAETAVPETSPANTAAASPGVPTPATNTPSAATNSGSGTSAEPANAVPATTPMGASTNAAPAENSGGPAKPVAVEASVIVLLYHQFVSPGVHVSPKFQWTMDESVFESEMKYIHDNGYHVVPMSDLLKFLRHEIGLPPNSVVITIDDGYKSAIVHAAPILKKYGYPWTFFVYPDFITVNEGAGAASWNDLLALQADGVDIECHSMTHPTLTSHHQKIKGVWHNFSQEEYDQWLTNETSGAKTLLEQKLGRPVTCFAYPYGAYNKEVEAKAIAAGFDAIFTVADNPVHSTTDMHSIGRYTITQAVEKNFTAYLRQGALGIANADPGPGTTITNPRPVITAVLGYAGTLDPNSIETSVRDFGEVKHDFDPKTSTLRLYLPRDLIQPVNLVNIRVKDAATGQVMVANWHFNYEAAPANPTHAPIATTTNAAPDLTNAPSAVTKSSTEPKTEPDSKPAPEVKPPSETNAPAATQVEKTVKSATTTTPSSSSKISHN